MAPSSLVDVASGFYSASEELHNKFLAMRSDEACAECDGAAFGEAILTAWIQTAWGEFTHDLVLASALGAQRRDGTPIQPLAGVSTPTDGEQRLRDAAKSVCKQRGLSSPVWHATWFAVGVGSVLGLGNLEELEAALAPTLVPKQITTVRNVLVHPGQKKAFQEYEALQAKLGMLNVAPQYLPRQPKSPGVALFTSWVRELQNVADDSTQ